MRRPVGALSGGRDSVATSAPRPNERRHHARSIPTPPWLARGGRTAMSQARFQKRMREKAKQEKQAAKRERRAERAEASEAADPTPTDAPPESTVLEQLAALHAQFADDAID